MNKITGKEVLKVLYDGKILKDEDGDLIFIHKDKLVYCTIDKYDDSSCFLECDLEFYQHYTIWTPQKDKDLEEEEFCKKYFSTGWVMNKKDNKIILRFNGLIRDFYVIGNASYCKQEIIEQFEPCEKPKWLDD